MGNDRNAASRRCTIYAGRLRPRRGAAACACGWKGWPTRRSIGRAMPSKVSTRPALRGEPPQADLLYQLALAEQTTAGQPAAAANTVRQALCRGHRPPTQPGPARSVWRAPPAPRHDGVIRRLTSFAEI